MDVVTTLILRLLALDQPLLLTDSWTTPKNYWEFQLNIEDTIVKSNFFIITGKHKNDLTPKPELKSDLINHNHWSGDKYEAFCYVTSRR